MSGFVRSTLRCLAVEPLKLRRTLAPVIAIVLPAVPAGVEALSVVNSGPAGLGTGMSRAGWFVYDAYSIWCLVLLPLAIALQSSLVAGIEHQSHGFRRLLCLPVPRASVYLAKLATNLALLAVEFAVLLVATWAWMRIAARMRPDAGLDLAFPWSAATRITLLTFLASWFLLAIHSYVALRWASFPLNVSLCVVGIVGTVIFTSGPVARIYPWGLPARVHGALAGLAFGWGQPGSSPSVHVTILLGFVAFAAIVLGGGLLLVRRDVT